MKKLKLLFSLFILTSIAATAQHNLGFDYFSLGEYDYAKKYYAENISKSPAEANFYLGEIAFSKGNTDEAKAHYEKGLAADASYIFNEIGLLKLNLKTDSKISETALTIIQKKNNSNINVVIAIGYAYLDNGLTDKAMLKADEARKIDKKNPKVYVLEGDILKAKNDLGAAAGKYDMANYFDPNYCLAYIKAAEVYEKYNWQVALEKLKEISKLQPEYIISYRNLGKIYNGNGYYAQASEAYKKYFSAGYYTLDDITRYVTALYFNKQYEEADKVVKEGLAIEPDNFVLNRLQMYAAANIRNSENGLKYAEKFFSIQKSNTSEYLAKDYSMYATILKDAKKFDESIEQYQKAFSIDNNIDAYKDMASAANAKGENGYAAELYLMYIDKAGDKVEALDYYQLGRYYYSAGSIRNANDTATILKLHSNAEFLTKIANNTAQKDSLVKSTPLFIKRAIEYYLGKAESSFDVVIERIPDGYIGYLWKARTNSLLDPESEVGLAKPHYEKTVEVITAKGDVTNATNAALIEAYSYLGYFFYLKSDNENTLLYWNKVLELDPNNTNAKSVLDSIKK